MSTRRILLSIAVLLSVLLLHFYVTLFLLAVGFLFFPRYAEGVFFVFLSEVIYSSGGEYVAYFVLPYTFLALAIFLLMDIFRSVMRQRNISI